MSKAVEYIFTEPDLQCKSWDMGWTQPGWYFWDETWSFCYGPYESAEIAQKKCKEYCEKVLGY